MFIRTQDKKLVNISNVTSICTKGKVVMADMTDNKTVMLGEYNSAVAAEMAMANIALNMLSEEILTIHMLDVDDADACAKAKMAKAKKE